MPFNVLVVTDSHSFRREMEAAFEPLSLLLLCCDTSLLAQPKTSFSDYLAVKNINIVVHAGFSAKVTAEHLNVLVNCCAEQAISIVHLSSYQVFGALQAVVDETVLPTPDTAHGEALLAAEQLVQNGYWAHNSVLSGQPIQNGTALNKPISDVTKNIVIRVPWTLMAHTDAPEDESVLDRACKALLGGTELLVSEEVKGFIITWSDVARAITAMIQQVLCGANSWGVFHLRSSDSCSEAEFADAAARLLKAEGFSVANVVALKGPGYLMQRCALIGGRRCTDDFGIQQTSFRVGLKGAVQRWVQHSGYVPAIVD